MGQETIEFPVSKRRQNGRKRIKILETKFDEIRLDNSNDDSNKDDDLQFEHLTEIRQAFHNSLPNSLPGRETEIATIYNFLLDHLQNQSSGSMYINGLPGTGKTACVSKALQQPEISNGFQIVSLNCTLSTSHASIFEKIAKVLNLKKSPKNRTFEALIKQYFESNEAMVLLLLDEVDQLLSKKQNTLQKLFELPLKKGAKLVIIGIANTFNLIEDALPKLLKRRKKPVTLTFATYNEDQIINILKSRLDAAKFPNIFSEPALKLMAKKVAAVSGDVRSALDLCQKVFDFLEKTKDTQIEISHVLNVLKTFHGTSQTLAKTTDECMPLQQKVILAIIVVLKTEKAMKSLTLAQLYDSYRKISAKAKFTILDQCEFNSVCSLIESNGFIKIFPAKDMRLSKITLESDHTNLMKILNENCFLHSIMEYSSSK